MLPVSLSGAGVNVASSVDALERQAMTIVRKKMSRLIDVFMVAAFG